MKHSVANGEATSLAALTRSPDYGARVIDILPVIGDADSTESVVALFRAAVAGLGADAGVFMSYLRDDATRASYRSCWPAIRYGDRSTHVRAGSNTTPGCATPPMKPSPSDQVN